MAAMSISTSSDVLVAPSTPEPTYRGYNRDQVATELERQKEQLGLEKWYIYTMPSETPKPNVNQKEKKAARMLRREVSDTGVFPSEVKKKIDSSSEMKFENVFKYLMWKMAKTLRKTDPRDKERRDKAEKRLDELLKWKIRGYKSIEDSIVHSADLFFKRVHRHNKPIQKKDDSQWTIWYEDIDWGDFMGGHSNEDSHVNPQDI